MKNIEPLLSQIEKLKSYQQERLQKIIDDLSVINNIDTEDITLKDMVCRHCSHSDFVKNGHSPGGHRRYKCKKCGSTQCADANTALYQLKLKEKWADFVFIMLDTESKNTCQGIADKLDINVKTAHSWRHRFASSVEKTIPLELSDELEADEIYLPFTVKGVIGKEKYDEWYGPDNPKNLESAFRIQEKNREENQHKSICLCVHNRNGDFNMYPIKAQKKGIVSEADLTPLFENIDLKDKTVITDSEPSMKASLKKIEGVNHLTFKSYEVKQGVMAQKNVHNNYINGTVSLLRDWLKQFRGVSTKYIDTYLKWFRVSRLFELDSIKKFVKYTLVDRTAHQEFCGIFDKYQKFACG